MEFVVGKTVHLSIMGFVIGAGIEAMRLVDAFVKDGVVPFTAPRSPLATVAAATGHAPGAAGAAASAAAAVGAGTLPAGTLLANRPPRGSAPAVAPAAATAGAAARAAATSAAEVAAVAAPSSGPRLWSASRQFWFAPSLSPFAMTASAIARLAVRPTWQQVVVLSLGDGARTARVLGTGTFVMGVMGFLRVGRDVDAIFDYTRDPVPLTCGVTAASLLIMPGTHRAARVGASAVVGAAIYWIAQRRARALQ